MSCGTEELAQPFKEGVGGWGWEREKYIDKAQGIIKAVKKYYILYYNVMVDI